jgi:hypothetical protein
MMAQPLPYDMGNAGDLMKHGLLAEFTQWWCRASREPIRFVDPFAGRPWVETPVPTVVRRVEALSGFAVTAAQPHLEKRYYGSAHVVRYAARAVGQHAEVLVSDRDPGALHDLLCSGLTELQYPGFDAADGYSILKTEINPDLILIDPFDSLVSREAPLILPEISKFSARVAIIVFVLIRDLMNADGKRYVALKTQHLSHAWSLRCPPLQDTGIKGEANYTAEVLLIAPKLLMQPTAALLREKLKCFAKRLSEVLAAPVAFSPGYGECFWARSAT